MTSVTPTHYQRVRDIFHEAYEMDYVQREAYLNRACASDDELKAVVLSFLRQADDESDSINGACLGWGELFIQGSHAGSLTAAERSPLAPSIDGYQIFRRIGEGGMGVVYEAQQHDPKRIVALKLMRREQRSNEHLVRLFQQEAQALARLRHPYIAIIYGTGRTNQGEPFFAMELVHGRPLTQYVQQAGLDMRQRLVLFGRVCNAVHYAHCHGVMHRDLKPANILIDAEGEPKILDFGLAKIIESELAITTVGAEIGRIAGTIPYMSPEQTRGNPVEVDIRSDVYSLGVILYELMACQLPYDVSGVLLPEAVRVICEEPPRRPSTIQRTFRGDLETIMLKALEKEPARRYASAAAFAEDIDRYLTRQPILAHPPSATYQLLKLINRHRLGFGLVAALFAITAGCGVVLSMMYARAETLRQQAEEHREEADRVADFLSETFRGISPAVAQGRDPALLLEMMDKAGKRIIDGELTDAPKAELRLRLTIGDVYRQLGAYRPAYEMLGPAEGLARSMYTDEHEMLASARSAFGHLLSADGKASAGLPRAEAALATWQHLYRNGHVSVAVGLNNVAICLNALGRTSEALRKHEASLAMLQTLFDGDNPNIAAGFSSVAGTLQTMGRHVEALPRLQDALAMLRRIHGDDDPRVAEGLNSVAVCLQKLGRVTEAIAMLEEACAINQRFFRGDHPVVAKGLNNLATCHVALGLAEQALPKLEAALSMRQRIYGDDHPEVATALSNVALCLQKLDRNAEALARSEAAVAMCRRMHKQPHPQTALLLHYLADTLQDVGQENAALNAAREAVVMYRSHTDWDPGEHHRAEHALVELLNASLPGHAEESAECARNILNIDRNRLHADDVQITADLAACGLFLMDVGTPAALQEAEVLLRECLAIRARLFQGGSQAWRRYSAMNLLGQALVSQAAEVMVHNKDGNSRKAAVLKLREAEPLLLDAAVWLTTDPSVPPPQTNRGPDRARDAVESVIRLYETWHMLDPDTVHLKKSGEWRTTLQVWQTRPRE